MRCHATIRLNSDVKPLSGFELVAQFCPPSPNQEHHAKQQDAIEDPMNSFAAQLFAGRDNDYLAYQRLAKKAKSIPVFGQCSEKLIHYTAPFFYITRSPLTICKNSIFYQFYANQPKHRWLTFYCMVKPVFPARLTSSRLTIKYEAPAATRKIPALKKCTNFMKAAKFRLKYGEKKAEFAFLKRLAILAITVSRFANIGGILAPLNSPIKGY